ncbi:aminotransferase class V-fold PLP-dependent enzyme [Asticcacaulis benevestitus]|uniref:Aminotransferase class V domain-containing protein n=1 Tax=Asticcacaulis benevestitus DSM 16100 = ATCC BAA-896 TaxID=1121022 RepID=V4NJH4_9CAUL|nr:aminotransferase class V-fold PLP-dependent enzyme [Asticcacaulis benevestitus]ESQ81987.1 hypothetical protein ABENE_21310 [Asticcacaulis benevestitus DSM 16100 = ATCC BAA-896]
MKRRQFLASALLGAASGALPLSQSLAEGAIDTSPHYEAGWSQIASAFPARPQTGVVNLEFGAFGQMPVHVAAAFDAYSAKVNAEGAYFTRRDFAPYFQGLRKRIAAMINADPGEIMLTRNATESLLSLIGGYNRLKSGDAVLISDHDYDSMQAGMRWLKTRRGVEVISINLPNPATYQNLIDTYEQALKEHPSIRLVLLTHIGHRSGLRLPVSDIIAMARDRGVDAIVDSAHAWGQGAIDVKADGFVFAGFNLHKWLGAPIGVGAVYIRADRITDIDTYMGQEDSAKDPIYARIHTGTANFAAQMAANDALDFHKSIGSDVCGARFTYLRDLWVKPAREFKSIEVLTPDDTRLHAGITSFRLIGDKSPEAHANLVKRLLETYNIFTVMRTGLSDGACIRVTPGYTTTSEDMARLLAALKAI